MNTISKRKSDSFITPTPREIVSELNRYIIGQQDAKRAVAIALRNRWRRMQLDEKLRHEVTPKNILMIGPTGVGKTEIARRLAKLARSPFIKVEATKFTEIGYVGRDVESIIRDLADTAVKMKREQAFQKVKEKAEYEAESRILAKLLSSQIKLDDEMIPDPIENTSTTSSSAEITILQPAKKETLRDKLRSGILDDYEIEIEVSSSIGFEVMSPPGMEDMANQLSSMFQSLSGERKKTRKIRVKDALKLLTDEESAKLINDEELKAAALESVEQNGIVFIDEIDKICQRSEGVRGGDVSREGVQRDLLPLIEGCTVSTKYGMIKTDHILFVASGAFHVSKPSDLVPELQGRLPIRVELKALTIEDFVSILTEPDFSLIKQYVALLKTENVELNFLDDGIKRIAEIAWEVNERQENIGARRLHTVLERLLEAISFEACDRNGAQVTIDKDYVEKYLKEILTDQDLSQYIL